MENRVSCLVLESIHLSISLDAAVLSVLSIPPGNVPKCAWLVLREYGIKVQMNSNAFHSIICDDDGMSIVCESHLIPTFEFLLNPAEYTLSSSHWRALTVHLTGNAYEMPGMVYCLANSLSQEGLSILHISTFEAEVFLIQEPDLEKVLTILRKFQDPEQAVRLLDEAWGKTPNTMNSHPRSILSGTTVDSLLSSPKDTSPDLLFNTIDIHRDASEEDFNSSAHNNTNEFDESWLAPQISPALTDAMSLPSVSSPSLSTISMTTNALNSLNLLKHSFDDTPRFGGGFTLCVLPDPVILARLRDVSQWAVCAPILTKLLLFDDRFSPLEKQMSTHPLAASANDNTSAMDRDTARAQHIWGMWHTSLPSSMCTAITPTSSPVISSPTGMLPPVNTAKEITFLLPESEVAHFPPDSLLISPQQWRVIKLCGRPIAFHETGIVSAMSKIDANIPTLNISTVTANCTLVPEELLTVSVEKLAQTFGCPVKYVSLV